MALARRRLPCLARHGARRWLAAEAMAYQPISLSSSMIRKVGLFLGLQAPVELLCKATRNMLNDIDLIVYDMAGTTVQERLNHVKPGPV